MFTTAQKLAVSIGGAIFTGIAEWLHSNVATLAGTLTVIYTLFCIIEKWPVICERTAAAWKRVRSWIPLLALCAFIGFAACGCQYVRAKKHIDTMKSESVKRVEAIQAAAKSVTAQAVPASGIVTQPPAVQEAQAKGVLLFWIGGGICSFVGLVLFALSFRAAGGTLAIGGIAMPFIANVAASPVAITACAGIVAVALAFIVAWLLFRYCKYTKDAPAPSQPLSPDTPAIVA